MNKLYLAIGVLFFISFSTFSQDDEVDEACNPPAKKSLKLIETAKNSEDLRTIVDNYTKAIEAEPENAMAYYEYGVTTYNLAMDNLSSDARKAERGFVNSANLFQEVLTLCEDYNAGTYYYLGVIRYMQKDDVSAREYLTKFVNFKSMDNDRFPLDYSNMLKNAKGQLKKWETTVPEEKVEIAEVSFEPFRIENVSSKDNEYFPMISPDNELMFYTRKLDRRLLGDMLADWREEFTFSGREAMAQSFDKGNPFTKPFNQGDFVGYGAATMSIDNKEMIICACMKTQVNGQDYKNCDLYSTTFSSKGTKGDSYNWTPLVSLGPNINSPNAWEGQPSISADGNALYYATISPNTRKHDIYISERKADGTWSLGRPFEEINTAGDDKSPFIHQDNETMYFVSESSEKRVGAGGLDIYYIKKKDGKWSKPTNIGIPINTPSDEIGLFVSTDGELAYFSSNKGGDYNIYGFKLYEEARPKPVMIMKGTLTDKKGKGVSGVEIEISYGDSDEVQKIKVNGDDGKYAAAIKLDPNKDVMVSAKKDGAAFSVKLITKEEIREQKAKKEVSVKRKDMEVIKVQLGQAYVIEDILYTTASAELNQNSKVILKAFARYLIENKTMKIVIQGHTDDVGDEEKNLQLSDDRARVVKEYLASQGVSKSRMQSQGFGETQPKLENETEEARAKNRRTEFKIVGL